MTSYFGFVKLHRDEHGGTKLINSNLGC